MGEVVPLGEAHATGAPVPEVVEMLEDLVAKARRGEIIGIACAWVDGGHGQFTGWRSGSTQTGAMIATTAMLAYRVVEATERE